MFNLPSKASKVKIFLTLGKFSHEMMSGAVDMTEHQDVTQRDLDKLERCTPVNIMRFDKAKRKVLHLGKDDPLYQYRLKDDM